MQRSRELGTCAPLSWWRAADVFAYLITHGKTVQTAVALALLLHGRNRVRSPQLVQAVPDDEVAHAKKILGVDFNDDGLLRDLTDVHMDEESP